MDESRGVEQYGFHEVVCRWFGDRFAGPTEPQHAGWPSIVAGNNTLISAPTGSGKTLTAFLACIDRLVKEGLERGLEDELRVVYVSPLRALSNDMQRNLETPLREIAHLAKQQGENFPELRAGLRTGDTKQSQRAAIVRRPPHILVTTPESLYLMLTGSRSREILRSVETVIVDEIHALVRDKRGSHLALTLERLEHHCERKLQRVGLSATQKPIENVARFLVGYRGTHECKAALADSQLAKLSRWDLDCDIVDVGHGRDLDLGIEVPPSELGAVCTHEQWAEVNERLVQLINEHRSTLIFVNTRRMAERVTHQLTELLGEDTVGSHHGSLSSDIRLETERKLKSGELKAVVATASLELGLDIGYIDLVIQLGSPRSIATFLQRIGRSGHSLGLTPKGRLFALSRDELVECMALVRSVRSGFLDTVRVPDCPLDVVAQQIVAEASAREWDTDELFDLMQRATPFHALQREDFDRTIEYLSEGLTDQAGRSRVFLHHDHVNRRIKARSNARITATTNGGAIPEIGSYRVVTDPDGVVVGTLDEDFAVESQRGDIFLLGNTSWRLLGLRGGDAIVADAEGAPPSVPFWRGEAPGRTLELSEAVSTLREDIEARLDDRTEACRWLSDETRVNEYGADQIVQYLFAQKSALGLIPTQRKVVFERFFDDTGGMQLVVHAPFGGDINRAWGFAMRKRFCRSFDFELQATADDDGFILSLGPQHSFPIESLFPMLNSRNARGLLEQAVLQVPMFQIRWRWNVTRALLVDRMQKGKKVPPALQRFRADDLLTAVFPKLTGCQEEHTGDHEIPDHPLSQQTLRDCLHEALDLNGLNRVLDQIQAGQIELIARDTREPSPFSYELLNSNPYAFLDGGEIQERRARSVATRRSFDADSVEDLGRLDPEAIAQVCREARPLIRNADELHDVLLTRIYLHGQDMGESIAWLSELVEAGRIAEFELPDRTQAWAAAERWPVVLAAFPDSRSTPELVVPSTVRSDWTSVEARNLIVRGLIETSGPITESLAAQQLCLSESQVAATLEALEGEGIVLRGRFTDGSFLADSGNADSFDHGAEANSTDFEGGDSEIATVNPAIPSDAESSVQERSQEWCHRRLLARIHRLTLQGLRAQVQPVPVEAYMQFLFELHGITGDASRTGTNGLYEAIAMLQGLDAPAISWERDLLAARLQDFDPGWLDELCLTGEVGWGRLGPLKVNPDRSRPMVSLTRVAPIGIWLRCDLEWLLAYRNRPDDTQLSSPGRQLLELFQSRGALFWRDLLTETDLLPGQVDEVLGELVTHGLVNSDGFAGLRRMIAERVARGSGGRRSRPGLDRQRNANIPTGRWSLWNARPEDTQHSETDVVEQWAWQLLRRWGVVFRDVLDREQAAPRWFELLQVYRRLEARGEIRGGRFIKGVAGEQFAVGDTVSRLRRFRDEPCDSSLVAVSAVDPLNLVGIVTKHARVTATAGNRVFFLSGRPIAAWQSGELVWIDPQLEEQFSRPVKELAATQTFVHRVTAVTESIPEDQASGSRDEQTESTDEAQRERRRQRRKIKRQKQLQERSSLIPRPRF